jgi:hypothetical protein
MHPYVVSRWFRLADLVLVSASGAIWYIWPQAGFWPLLLALPGWVARGMARRFPFRLAVIHLSLVVFLLTAAVGVWAAPQGEAAWGKFWVLFGGVLLFYTLADQPEENLGFVAGLFSLFAVVLSISFLLFNDWQTLPLDLRILDRITSVLSRLRPSLPVVSIHANMVGGILAMLFPFPLALGLYGWKTRMQSLLWVSAGICGIIAAGLVLSSSRGAWLALLLGLVIWFLWGFGQRFVLRAGRAQRFITLAAFLLVGLLLVGFVFSSLGGFSGLDGRLAGISSGRSRVDLAGSAIQLIEDFPFTGSGLRSFPGLFSYYIRVTPYFMFEYAHNFYLDVALEQGVFGLIALAIVLVASLWFAASSRLDGLKAAQVQLLRGAVFAGLMSVCLHGFVDDPLYGGRGTPLVFLLAGLAVALTRPEAATNLAVVFGEERAAGRGGWAQIRIFAVVVIAVFGLTLAVLPGWRNSLISSWYANLGAVKMAKQELVDFPTGRWAVGKDVSKFAPAQSMLTKSLAIDPNNRTANHRSGLIALQAQDFEAASAFLERASLRNPAHRGVRKNLGYSYVWSGNTRQAAAVLAEIPEAKYEMSRYVRWWRRQGRLDLSQQAYLMTTILHDRTSEQDN